MTTCCVQALRLCARDLASPHRTPRLSKSVFTTSIHRVLGRPTGRRPAGTASNSRRTNLVSFILTRWPYQRSLELRTYSEASDCLDHAIRSELGIWSRLDMFQMRRKHRLWKTSIRFIWASDAGHVSAPYISDDNTTALNTRHFVLREICFFFHSGPIRDAKDWDALRILSPISSAIA